MSDKDTKLPEGKSCANCVHVVRCLVLLGVKHTSTTCEYAPSRFQERDCGEEPGGAARRPYEKPEMRELASGPAVELARALGQLEGVEAAIEALEPWEGEHHTEQIAKALEQLASAYGAECNRLRQQFEERKAL